ncbi:M28 family metallopeptidase [Oryzobacter telluris]|uniref:M28 family metallopeptidase n=1 Tax=Oryzobacter telluris TaxID=3149179 RepID=UPI00370D5737
MTRRLLRAGGVIAAGVVALSVASPAQAATEEACANRVNNTHAKLAECVTVEGVRAHREALQEIATQHGGTRVSGTAGYDASVAYVVDTLRAAGYTPTVQELTVNTFVTTTPTLLERVAPDPAVLATAVLSYSGSGDVTAPVFALPADPTPGCEATDFAGFPAGAVALVPRGSCTFALKATNAAAAGATAVVITNNTGGALDATLGADFALDIPVVSVTQELGAQLAATSGLVLHVRTATLRGPATTANVIAETQGGNPDNVVMAGAHLDSVNAGPGINDNGSGAAALLEVAVQMAGVDPTNRVRFAWWGAEESGLLGSTHYVSTLAQADRDRIALYLNFDMVGSPNHVFFVYDGDDSDAVGAGPGPEGSARIEKTFEAFYSQRGIPWKGTDFTGRSDYGPFIAAGIPAGGLFTGAEGVKTVEEATRWGGTAGIPYDPCYHQACDDVDNSNDEALDVNADAMAFGILQYAMSTVDVNGVPGKGNFAPVSPLVAPVG